MSGLLGSLLSFLLLYKYSALFVLILLGSAGIIVPTVTLVIAAAAFAGQGYLNWYAVTIVSIVASILGDIFFYWLARHLEERALRYTFFRRLFSASRRAAIEKNLQEHPIITIFGSRFINLTTILVNVLAGFTQFPFTTFLWWDVLGETGSTLLYTITGYMFGSDWTYISDLLEKTGTIVILLVGAIVLWQLIRYRKKRHSP